MLSRLFAIALLIAGLGIYFNSSAIQTPTSDDLLKPWLKCEFDDELKVMQKDHRPKGAEKFRMVDTTGGKKRVSVIDGYRVMFSYPDANYFFANVKVELSDPQAYAEDKLTIIDQMKYLAEVDKNSLLTKTYNGFEGHGIEDPIIDRGGTMALQVLFSDADKMIVTVYFLNQGNKNRRFKTVEEFRSLKDNFLETYTSCARVKAEKK